MGVDVNSHTRRLKNRYVKVKAHDRAYPHSPPIGELGALILVPTLAVACTLGVSWFIVKNTAKLAGKAVGTLAPNQTVKQEPPPMSKEDNLFLFIGLTIAFFIIPIAGLFCFVENEMDEISRKRIQNNVHKHYSVDAYVADMQKAVDKMLAE
jgi:hypothetical protein